MAQLDSGWKNPTFIFIQRPGEPCEGTEVLRRRCETQTLTLLNTSADQAAPLNTIPRQQEVHANISPLSVFYTRARTPFRKKMVQIHVDLTDKGYVSTLTRSDYTLRIS